MKPSKILSSALLTGAALLSLAPALKAQTTIAGWTFDNDPVASPTLNPTPSTNNSVGAVSAASIGMTGAFTSGNGTNTPDVLVGVSGDTGTNSVADMTNTWRIRAVLTGNASVNGWSSGAPLGSQGAQFNVDTTGFSNIKISFDWYATNQGEANLQLQYTTNGTTWINTPITLSGSDTPATVVNNSSGSLANTVVGSYINGGTAGQQWFTGLTATISDPNAANDPNFGIQMVNATTGSADLSIKGTALNNTSGNWRFDNVAISGTPVPEPGTGAALLGGLGMLLGFGKMRRGSCKA